MTEAQWRERERRMGDGPARPRVFEDGAILDAAGDHPATVCWGDAAGRSPVAAVGAFPALIAEVRRLRHLLGRPEASTQIALGGRPAGGEVGTR